MPLRYLTGTALQAALMRLGRYCFDKEQETGREANVPYLMERANARSEMVPPENFNKLVNDVERAYVFLRDQELEAMSRYGYAKFRAANFLSLEDELERDLENLQTT